MHKYQLFIFLLLLIGCSENSTDINIYKFEKVLGKEKTKVIDMLVFDFEQNLEKIYPNVQIEKAYHKYLTDMISDSTIDFEKFKFQSEKTNKEFNKSGLWKEIYEEDSKNNLRINSAGKYIQALYAVKDSDSLVKNYLQNRQAAGMMPNELVVPGILSYNPDFENYFHKRIVVIEFSF